MTKPKDPAKLVAYRERRKMVDARYRARHPEARLEANRRFRERHPEKIAEFKKRQYDLFRERLTALKAGGCVDCGLIPVDLADLHFHHVDPSTKKFNVSNAHSHSVEKLTAEAAKCVVVCDPCHRERHRALRLTESVAA